MTPFLGRRKAYNYTVDNWNIICSFSSKSFQCSISMESIAGQLICRTLVVSWQLWRRPLGSRHRHLVWHRAAVRVRESVSGHLSSTYLGHLLPTNLNTCHLFCKSCPPLQSSWHCFAVVACVGSFLVICSNWLLPLTCASTALPSLIQKLVEHTLACNNGQASKCVLADHK